VVRALQAGLPQELRLVHMQGPVPAGDSAAGEAWQAAADWLEGYEKPVEVANRGGTGRGHWAQPESNGQVHVAGVTGSRAGHSRKGSQGRAD